MSVIPGVRVTGPIVPTDTADTYATHNSAYGAGGLHEEADATARNAISEDRRHVGMIVYTTDDLRYWRLLPEPWFGTDADWKQIITANAAQATVGPLLTMAEYLASPTVGEIQTQAAIDAVSDAGGGTVHVLPGTYNLSAFLVPRSNVHLKGSGIGVTILLADAVADIRRMFFNDGTVVGEPFCENFTLSDMTVDMNNRQSMGLEIRFFREYHQFNVEWRNIECEVIGGASRWGTKFGTVVPGDIAGSESSGLYIENSWYHDNFCRTFEVILCANVRGGAIHHNKLEYNSSMAPNYDEISLFIFNTDIDCHDNYSYNSKYHGIGTKESRRSKVHHNTIVKNELWASNYIGFRAWNTIDCDITNNTMVFPDPLEVEGDIIDINDPVTLYPGAWNETIITATSTIELTDGSLTTDMYRGQPVYSDDFPEGATVLQIDDPVTFHINRTAPLTTTGSIVTIGALFYGVTHADRSIGYDGHTLRNEYTRNLTIKGNKARNAYIGVSSGSASLGVDTDADCDISGTTLTLTEARYTIEGVLYTVTTPGEMTEYLAVGQKMSGTGIPPNTRITAVDTTLGTVTVDNSCTTGTGVLVLFDANTISYRHEEINISDNEFPGIQRAMISWGVDHIDTDIRGFHVKRNTTGQWRGSVTDAIKLTGYSSDPSLFRDVYIEDNTIGENIEGTDNGGIGLSGITVSRLKGNVIPTHGTRGRVRMGTGAIINDLQDNWIAKTANYTLGAGDENVMVDATSGAITITPPDPTVNIGKEYLITKSDASANAVIINPVGAATINGAASYSLTVQYQSVRIKSNGVQYYVIYSGGPDASTLQTAFDAGQAITIANTANKVLAVTQNDTTNNPNAFNLTNAATAHGQFINQTGVNATNKYALFVDSSAAQVNSALVRLRQNHASSTQPTLQLDNAGSGAALSLLTGFLNINAPAYVGAKLNIRAAAIPLSLTDSGATVTTGGLWRIPLTGGVMRFDVNTAAGGDFSTFVSPFSIDWTTGKVTVSFTGNPGFQVGDGTTGYFKLGDATFKKQAGNFFSFNGDGVQGINKLTIGQDSPDVNRPLLVKNSVGTGNVVATIQGIASQSADLLQLIDSSGTVLASISAAGVLSSRIAKRVLALSANSATPTINTDSYDAVHITAQTAAITSFTSGLTGTPTDDQPLLISITGTGSVAITWGASFEDSTVLLPASTVGTARLDVGLIWNTETSKWRCVAVA